jgi:hypothetical protein
MEMDMTGWRDIASAPRDGTKFWGDDGEDAIAMFWHEGFGEFVSSFSRMTMAPGYLIDDKPFQDHHPVIHHPTMWMPRLPLPLPPTNGANNEG